jgi:transposase
MALAVLNPNAAGIDVGGKFHLVAVPSDRDPEPVRSFEAFTPQLHELAAWLKRCGIETVAMESTGIYWIALSEVLERYGFGSKPHAKRWPTVCMVIGTRHCSLL